jgi:hypothetical protein
MITSIGMWSWLNRSDHSGFRYAWCRTRAILVGVGHRDQHVGVARPGLLQHVGMRGEADEAGDVERLADLLDQLRRLVDDRHVGVLAGQVARDVEADLAGPAHDHFHGAMTFMSGVPMC